MEIKELTERMHNGDLYYPGDPNLVPLQTERLDMLYDYNATRPTEAKNAKKFLKISLPKSARAVISSRRFTQIGAENIFISENLFTQISI